MAIFVLEKEVMFFYRLAETYWQKYSQEKEGGNYVH